METMFDNQENDSASLPEAVFKIEEGEKVYDDAFVVRKSRYGLYHAIGTDGRKWVTALTEEDAVHGTRFNLKAEIDGTLWTGDNVRVVGSGIMEGKL